MNALQPAAVLRTALTSAHANLVNDLHALTEEQAAERYGGAARSAVEVVTECAAINAMFAGFLTTGQIARPTPEERAAFFASVTTRAGALEMLEQNTQTLLSAVDAFDPARWGEAVAGFESRFTTIWGGINFAALHMMYHDGQLNLLHTLHGDTAMHWAA